MLKAGISFLVIAATAPHSFAQIGQFQLKESRTFVESVQSHMFYEGSWGYMSPADRYFFSSATNTVTVPENKKLSLLDFSGKTGRTNAILVNASFGGSSEKFPIASNSITGSSARLGILSGPIIGPCVIEFILKGSSDFYIGKDTSITDPRLAETSTLWRYEISDYGGDPNSQPSNLVSAASVVVPANATGDVDVLLEQSTDMITWTQCLPGTYNASTQKRFFRVRAVEK